MRTFLNTATIILGILIGLVMLSGCNSAEYADRHRTRELQKEASAQAGFPNITNFTEKKFAKMIIELRDQEIATYTYTVNMQGERRLLCRSIGYGLPYTVQYTNPQNESGRPMAEPSGLYMPDGLGPTWVLCSGEGGRVTPVYVEPELLVSPFPLDP